jgi:DNA-directed RNA polymerase specialized sigma subunit
LRYDRDHTPRHSKAELNAAAIAARDGGPDEAETLRQMMRPYVVARTRWYDQKGDYTRDQSDEIKQTAWAAVWLALETFDPEAGTKFSTWAYFYMMREITQWMAKNSRGIPLSRRAWEQSKRIEEAFYEVHGPDADPYAATDEQLAALEISDTDNRKRTRTVEQAGDILRAKRAAFEMDPELDDRSSAPAEHDYFDEVHDMDTDALKTVSAMAEALAEGDAYEMAAAFIDRHDLPDAVAERMVEQAELGA